jgi:DNA polymerase-1
MNEIPESVIFITTEKQLEEVIKNQIRPYYEQHENPKFAFDLETYSLYSPILDLYDTAPRPIRLPGRYVSNFTTRQEMFMEFEGLPATFQLGSDPRILDRQWVIDVKKVGIPAITRLLKDIMESSILIGHNLKYDTGFLMAVFDIWPDETKLRDTQLIDSILISGRRDKTRLSDNYRRYLDYGFFVAETGYGFEEYESKKHEMQSSDWTGDPDKHQIMYAAEDVRLIFFVYESQKEKLKAFRKKHPKAGVFDIIKMECRIIPEVALMELRGIDFDYKYHTEVLIPYLEDKYKQAYKEACEILPNPNPVKTKGRGVKKYEYQDPINLSSSTQVPKILEMLGVKVPNAQEDTLKAVRREHPGVELILKCKKASYLLSSFGYKLLRFVHEDGRIYPNFRQIGTETGRFSGNSPNMQQIPSKELLFGEKNSGELFRTSFISGEGFVFIDSDYSNIEPRLIAHITQCVHLMNAFKNGVDYHGFTAQILLCLPEIPKKGTEEREVIGKIANLSLGYCAGPKTLKDNLYVQTLDREVPIRWTDQEAREKHEKYFDYLPEVKLAIEAVKAEVEKALASHNTLADFAGRKPIFTVFTKHYRRHRSFYLHSAQEAMARHKAKGDPREHPLHRWNKVTKEIIVVDEVGNPTGEIIYKESYYNEFARMVNDIARESYNFLIQCEAANMLKVSILNMGWREMKKRGFDVFKEGPILCVHDEILFRAYNHNQELAKNFVQESMVKAGKAVITSLPVKADPGADVNWSKAKP